MRLARLAVVATSYVPRQTPEAPARASKRASGVPAERGYTIALAISAVAAPAAAGGVLRIPRRGAGAPAAAPARAVSEAMG